MTLPTTQRVVWLEGPERIGIREQPLAGPDRGELLVRIEAATTCGTDLKVFRRGGHPTMLVAPSPFGHEMSGTVVAAGDDVERWKEGDAVVVANSASCGACRYCRIGKENLCSDLVYLNGAYGEYIRVPSRFAERSTYHRPAHLPARIAAMAEPLACVLHGIDECALPPASDVALVGAGPIGLMFVAVLVAAGHRVVVTDPHRERLDVARLLGASATFETSHETIDEKLAGSSSSRDGFDLSIEATGSPLAWRSAIGAIRPGGIALLFGGCAPGSTLPLDTHRLHYGELTLKGSFHHRPSTFAKAIELLAEGAIRAELLLSATTNLEGVEEALRSMIRRESIKVAIVP